MIMTCTGLQLWYEYEKKTYANSVAIVTQQSLVNDVGSLFTDEGNRIRLLHDIMP